MWDMLGMVRSVGRVVYFKIVTGVVSFISSAIVGIVSQLIEYPLNVGVSLPAPEKVNANAVEESNIALVLIYSFSLSIIDVFHRILFVSVFNKNMFIMELDGIWASYEIFK